MMPSAPTASSEPKRWPAVASLNGVVWLSCLGPGAELLRLVFQFPFNMPYGDDWALTDWAVPGLPRDAVFAPSGYPNWGSWWFPISGHQSIILKLINRALGVWLSWDLFYISVLSTIALIAGGLLVLSNFRQLLRTESERRVAFALAFAALALILLTPRQMQNLAANICLPWTLALACVGGFACLLQADRLNPTNWRLLALTLLTITAPMTIGFGLVIPLYIAVLVPFEFLGWTAEPQPLRRSHLAVLVASAVASVAVSYGLPYYFLGGAHLVPTTSDLGRTLMAPIEPALFVLAYTGQAFTPQGPESITPAIAWGGALLAGFVVAVLARVRVEGPSHFVSLVRSHSLLLMSLAGMMMVLTRAVVQGNVIALETRYTTAAALLVVCILAYVIDTAAAFRLSKNWMILASGLLLGVGVYAWQVGHTTGSSWIAARSSHARSVVECLRGQQPLIDLTVANPCLAPMNSSGWFEPARFNRWLHLLHQHRLTFFADL